MPSKEEIFKSRFAARHSRRCDDIGTSPQELALVGSLADRIVAQALQIGRSWTAFKANLSS